MGGEEAPRHFVIRVLPGLPPRGRGRGTAIDDAFVLGRITPAWAGKSPLKAHLSGELKDYPRVGGEEHTGKRQRRVAQGLPPRGRGRVTR